MSNNAAALETRGRRSKFFGAGRYDVNRIMGVVGSDTSGDGRTRAWASLCNCDLYNGVGKTIIDLG